MRGHWDAEHDSDAMAKLLSLPQPPTAVYVHSDEVTTLNRRPAPLGAT